MNLPPAITNRAVRKGPPPPPKPPKRAPIKTVPEGEELVDVPVSESGLGAYHSTSEETQEVSKQEEQIKSEANTNVYEKESLSHESTLANEAANFNTYSTEEKNGNSINESGNFFNDNEKETFINTEQLTKTENVEIQKEVEVGERFVPPAPRKPIAPPSKKSGGAAQGRKPINVPKPPVKAPINESNKGENEIDIENRNKFGESNEEGLKEETKIIEKNEEEKEKEKELQFETPRKDFEEEQIKYQLPSVHIKEKVNAPAKTLTTFNEKSSSRKITEMKNKLKDHSIRRDKLLESCESEEEREYENKPQNKVQQTSKSPFNEQNNLLADEQFEGIKTNVGLREEKDNYDDQNENKAAEEQKQEAEESIIPNHSNFTISSQFPEAINNQFDHESELHKKKEQTNNHTKHREIEQEAHPELMIDEAHVPHDEINLNNDRISSNQMQIVSENLEEEEAKNEKEDGKIEEIHVGEAPETNNALNKHRTKISSEKVINELKNLGTLSENTKKVEVFELIDSFSAKKESYLKNAQELTKLCQENRDEEEKKITIINELLAKLEEQNIRLHSILMQN